MKKRVETLICDGCGDSKSEIDYCMMPLDWINVSMEQSGKPRYSQDFCGNCAKGNEIVNTNAPNLVKQLFAKMMKHENIKPS